MRVCHVKHFRLHLQKCAPVARPISAGGPISTGGPLPAGGPLAATSVRSTRTECIRTCDMLLFSAKMINLF